MKKLDKLILASFIGPFILTFLVMVFILLNTQMLKYYDDIIGKDIGFVVLINLMFDFSIFMAPTAFPLAVLLSSLMTFGHLGEHYELAAIKSAGISLIRAIVPIFIFVVGLTVFAFYFNNYFVPKAALNAYSLLYDIKQKKPALDLKEGAFHNGIPDLSIKVNKKEAESGKIWDVIIYDHRDKSGNKKVTLADSGKMYTVLNDQYMILELYHGHSYIEGQANAKSVSSRNTKSKAESLSRIKFDKSKIVLDLSSFGMTRTDQDLFSSNRIMRNLSQLREDMDSLHQDVLEYRLSTFKNTSATMRFLSQERLPLTTELKNLESLKDSLLKISRELQMINRDSLLFIQKEEIKEETPLLKKRKIENAIVGQVLTAKKTELGVSKLKSKSLKSEKSKEQLEEENIIKRIEANKLTKEKQKINDFIKTVEVDKENLKTTINRVRQIKSKINNSVQKIEKTNLDRYVFEVQWHKIISNSFACLVMFLIGAPLGAIIKKGGLGIPVLISIFFFIVFYVFGMIGEKQAKLGVIDPILGVWAANIVLLPVGLFFLRQARNDARLFDADFYNVVLDKVKSKIRSKD